MLQLQKQKSETMSQSSNVLHGINPIETKEFGNRREFEDQSLCPLLLPTVYVCRETLRYMDSNYNVELLPLEGTAS